MEIKTANDLYRFAREVCVRNNFVGEDKLFHGFILPRVVCKDGWSISIQAGRCMYSFPREDLADEYSAFELGYASQHEPLLDEWAETIWTLEENPRNMTDYTKCIFPFTPVEVIDAVLEKHGGIDHLGKD